MENGIKVLGEIFAFEVPLLLALVLGVVYIIAFFGAVYYGVDLCQKFEESVIGKPIKIILVLTPIALIFYTPLLRFYPEQFVTINATIGLLEIVSLIYLIMWQSIYIFFEFYIRVSFFAIRVLIYMMVIGLGLLLVGIQTVNYDYLIIAAVTYRLFEIREQILSNLFRIYRNFIFNVKCIVTF